MLRCTSCSVSIEPCGMWLSQCVDDMINIVVLL